MNISETVVAAEVSAGALPSGHVAKNPAFTRPHYTPVFQVMAERLESALELIAEKQATIDKLRDLLRSARDGSRAAEREGAAR